MLSINPGSSTHSTAKFSDVQSTFASNSIEATSTISEMTMHAEASHPVHSERPVLTPPHEISTRSDCRLLAATEDSRVIGDEILKTFGLRLSNVKNEIQNASNELLKKLKEAAERASNSNWWAVLKKIATSLVSALSIVFGVALVASGGGALIGGAMIASGILSLANFALSETEAWEWIAKQLSHDNEEWQKKLTMILPAAVGVAACGLGAFGSAYGLATGAIQFAQQAVYLAQTALAVFSVTATFGKGVADTKLLWTQADQERIQSQLSAMRTIFDSVFEEIKGSLSDFKSVSDKTKQTLQLITKSNNELVREV